MIHTLTRSQPPGWNGYARRIDAQMLADTAFSPGSNQLTYICGPTSFVEAAARALVLLGHEAKRIKTERFFSSSGTPWISRSLATAALARRLGPTPIPSPKRRIPTR